MPVYRCELDLLKQRLGYFSVHRARFDVVTVNHPLSELKSRGSRRPRWLFAIVVLPDFSSPRFVPHFQHLATNHSRCSVCHRYLAFMRRLSLHLLLIALASLSASGQESAQQKLQHAFQLNERGQFAEAIELVQPLTSAVTLSGLDLGRAWLALAMAYHQEARYQEATSAYEQSLQILSSDPKYAAQYAGALHTFAILYRDMGDAETAKKILVKALSLFNKLDDHAGATNAYRSLADIAISKKRTREARGYLQQAFEASRDANGLNDDSFAALFSTQAWLNETDKNYPAAELAYQHALALWKHMHGEQHFLVGWGYMLVGKSNAEAGNAQDALDNMRKGLEILEKAVGSTSIMFLEAELAYAAVLNTSGDHAQARDLKATAEEALRNLYGRQCVQCRISAAALSLR
jgi:tetratricopeptide (TPR) repeat protein